MKIARQLSVLIMLAFGLAFSHAQNSAPTDPDEVLLRLTAEPMVSSGTEIPVRLQRVDKPGQPVDLVAAPGAVDAAVIPPGVYQLTSQKPVEVNGQQYQWQMQIPVFDRITRIRLSVANAVAVNVVPPEPALTSIPAPQPVAQTSAKRSLDASVEVSVKVDPTLAGSSAISTPIELRRLDRAQPPIASTLRNGVAQLRVAPGTYEIVTTQPISIGTRKYYWDMEAPLTDASNQVQLSEWQALVLGPTGER